MNKAANASKNAPSPWPRGSHLSNLSLIESSMIESLFTPRYREGLIPRAKIPRRQVATYPITPEAALKYSNRSHVTAYSGHA